MDLEVKPGARHLGIHKQLFQLKTSRRDGMILQIHHTIPGVSGEIRRIRFMHVAFNDAGEQLATVDHRGNIFIIDLASNKFWLLSNKGLCTTIAFSPYSDNEVIVATTNGPLLILNTELARTTGSLEGHSVPATRLSFAQNRFCLSASSQEAFIWDLQSNSQAHRLSLRSDTLVKQVVFMPVSNNILACFQDDAMNIWRFHTFEFIKQIVPDGWRSHHIKAFAFTRNGRAMVVGGHSPTLIVFALDSWSVKKVIDLPEGISGITHLEFVPQHFDGGANKILGILSANCVIHFLDTESSSFLSAAIEPGSSIRTFTCSPNGKYIAVVLRSGEVNIYISSKLIEVKQCSETPLSSEKTTPIPQQTGDITERHKAFQRKLTHASQQRLQEVQRQIQETLDLQRLRPILKEFGEYPESYRGLIWKTILQLPQNQSAYVGLVNRDCHPAYLHLDDQYPLENRSLLKNLKRLLSCLAHWSALFGEVKFLPLFVFPFVKVFQNNPFTCFEAVATIIVNWCQYWFEYFPFPPINILAVIENVLAEQDPELMELFYSSGVTSRIYAWPLLEVAFSEVLSTSEWLKFWDHVISNEPSFLLMAVVSYNISCRATLHTCQNLEDFEYFFHNQNPIDMKRFISKTYTLCKKTSDEIHPRQYLDAFTPLTKDVYPVYNQYPKFIVDYQAQQLEMIRKEEEKNVQEELMAMKQKVAQEKWIHQESKAELQQSRLLKLEDAYRETIRKEEERVANQRQRIVNLRRELRSRELELLNIARDRILHQHTKQRTGALDRLLEDIARKREEDETELAATEEEFRHHYAGLLLQKRKLQEILGLPHEAVLTPNVEHTVLQQQQNQLRSELKQLHDEASSERHAKQVQITSRIAAVDDLLQRVEMELAKEMAERQQHLMSSEENVKVIQLESQTKSLELEVQRLLEKISEMRLHEGRMKLQAAALSRADRMKISQEQKELIDQERQAQPHTINQNWQLQGLDKRHNWLSECINKKNGVKETNESEELKVISEDRNRTVHCTQHEDLHDIHRYPNTSVRSSAFYRQEQHAVKSAMNLREHLLYEGSSTARSKYST